MTFRQLSYLPVVLGLLITGPLAAGAQEKCVVQKLAPSLKWIGGLEFNQPANEVLIVDPSSKKLWSLGLKSEKLVEVPVSGGFQPTALTKVQGGFLLKNRDDVATIGPNHKQIRERFSLRSTKSGRVSGLSSLYSNWVTRGTTFLGFGSVSNPLHPRVGNVPFDLGFVTGEISAASGEFSKIVLLESTEENDLYLLGTPYFAANDLGFFFVKLGQETASLVRVVTSPKGGLSLEELPVFPRDFRKIPSLKADSGELDGTVADRFRSIERSRMVAGLFGQGTMLYILTRSWTATGTEWLLHQVDPARGELGSVLRLPTKAPHLSVAVGTDSWLLFERGSVRAWGDQDIKSVVKVPVSWIAADGTSPLDVKGQGDVKCSSAPPIRSPAPK